MHTESFIVYIKTEDSYYIDIEKDVETRFDASNNELERPLLRGKKRDTSVIFKSFAPFTESISKK